MEYSWIEVDDYCRWRGAHTAARACPVACVWVFSVCGCAYDVSMHSELHTVHTSHHTLYRSPAPRVYVSSIYSQLSRREPHF
jgi:hypothetical protein